MTDPHGEHGAYSEVFEEGKDLQQAQTIHRIRANSSIMQLKKILGGSGSVKSVQLNLALKN
jgi:pyruvate carboxylase